MKKALLLCLAIPVFSGAGAFADEIALNPSYSVFLTDLGKFYKPSFGIGAEYDWQWDKYWSFSFMLRDFPAFKSKIGKTTFGPGLPSPAPNNFVSGVDQLTWYYAWGVTGYDKGGISILNLGMNVRIGTPRDRSARFYFDFGPGIAKVHVPEYEYKTNSSVFKTTSTYWDGTALRYYGNWNTTSADASEAGEDELHPSLNVGAGLLFDISENLTAGIDMHAYAVDTEGEYAANFLTSSIKLTYRFGSGGAGRLAGLSETAPRKKETGRLPIGKGGG